MSSSRPELMAPAGDWDALKAAVANGADSVYFGLGNFNARHRAQNFTMEDLPQVMDYIHSHNVKGFLTFNTLIFSDELVEAEAYIRAIADAGVDAVIVQDLGLARLIHETAPGLELHGSTQMTLTEPRGIRFVAGLGIKRVVLARELSIPEIRAINEKTTVETEVFVHGALCVAYSGQCLTSESLGGRSANRGQCAQACRLPYDLIVDGQFRELGDKAYLLSPQDLAAYDVMDELVSAGVKSFKIEGRLKSAHYVAATTQTYRRALDVALGGKTFAITPEQKLDLEQSFSRGFTHGFLGGVDHQELVTARFPKARGTRIGTVAAVTPRGLVIQLETGHRTPEGSLKPGDGVVFDEGHPEQDEQGGRVFAVRPGRAGQVEIELGHGDVNLAAIAAGAIVWKTDDPAVRKRLEHSFARETVVRRVPVDVRVRAHVGETLRVMFVAEGRTAAVEWDKPLEAAQKFPVSEAVVREQLGRLGDTPYELGAVEMDVAGGPMVPKSVLNDLRRRGVEMLLAGRGTRVEVREGVLGRMREEALRDKGTEALRDEGSAPAPLSALVPQCLSASLYVLVRTLEQLDAVLAAGLPLRPAMVYCDFEDVRRYRDAVAMGRAAGMPIGLATLRVVKPQEEGFLRQIATYAPDAVLVRNLAAVSFYREHVPGLPMVGDYSLNVANELTAKLLLEQGLVRLVPSYDLAWKQLAAMVARSVPGTFETVVHQHMPMFHMEHCVFAHTLSNGKDYRDCGRPCDVHRVDLRDRMGAAHPLIPDVGCRNTVYNGQAQTGAEYVPEMKRMGIGHFRVELLRETPAEVPPLLSKYGNVLLGREEPLAAVRSLRVLNQLGVTRGTLARE